MSCHWSVNLLLAVSFNFALFVLLFLILPAAVVSVVNPSIDKYPPPPVGLLWDV